MTDKARDRGGLMVTIALFILGFLNLHYTNRQACINSTLDRLENITTAQGLNIERICMKLEIDPVRPSDTAKNASQEPHRATVLP